MINLFSYAKRKRLTEMLLRAFPKECREDVKYVCRCLPLKSYTFNVTILCEEQTEWILLSGETIKIPYRIYLSDRFIGIGRLTSRQEVIYHCIFSRSCDGYVREKHIKALLDIETPEWAMPFVLKVCDEYVKEILEAVYQILSEVSCEKYRELCLLNFDYFKLGHCRMISYWNEYYRYECYRLKDYIGKRLYEECFGYRKTGQKTIQIK